MIQIRRGVFETNSSSTHSITMCTEDAYERWKNGELLFSRDGECFLTREEVIAEIRDNEYYEGPDPAMLKPEDFQEATDGDIVTYEQWFECDYLECYKERFTTPGGEIVIAFGKYGYDG